jgi:CCR4-NOT transcriptional regulation complex NOT5 subunit
MVAVLSAVVMVPIFADDITQALNTTNATNISTNNSSVSGNSTLNSTNTTLTSQQLQTLTDTQSKLTALIAKIESLKATYGSNTKAKGLLNALDQFERQANSLNSEIEAFKQNPTITDGQITSFVNREAALEHKVSIKEGLLLKMSTKTAKTVKNSKQKQTNKKQKNNKGQNN